VVFDKIAEVMMLLVPLFLGQRVTAIKTKK
jgi:hypothetical protein